MSLVSYYSITLSGLCTQHVVLKSATDIDSSYTGNTEKMVEDSWVWVSVWIINVELDIFFE